MKIGPMWLVGLLVLLLSGGCSGAAEPLAEVRRAVTEKRAVLVDVREQAEWEAGHLREARLLPLSQLRENPKQKLDLPKDQPVYLYCRSGRRSQVAARILQEQGYDARSLAAGYAELLENGFAGSGK